MAPKRTTRSTPVTPTTTVTEAQLQALIDQGVAAAMAEAETIAQYMGGMHMFRPLHLEAAHAMQGNTNKIMTDNNARGEIKKIETESDLKVLIHRGAITARGLAIWPRIVEADLQMLITTTATTTIIIRREMVAMSAELKDI
ncbi:hypothetical protein Tco_0822153 [Tanacetum coccineum]|uniref:Uncharacterized protein n=1 Tax=Tanacetum coccineum TaxID=301880 RepID=A0ABQ5AJ45_9ASTR